MASATAPLPSLDAVKLAFAESGRPPFPKDDHAATTSQATARQGFALWTGLYRIMDTGAALAALVFTFVVTNLSAMPRGLAAFMAVRITLRSVLYLTLFAVVWRGGVSAFGLYGAARLPSGKGEASRILAACSFGGPPALFFPLPSPRGRVGRDRVGPVFPGASPLQREWPVRPGYARPVLPGGHRHHLGPPLAHPGADSGRLWRPGTACDHHWKRPPRGQVRPGASAAGWESLSRARIRRQQCRGVAAGTRHPDVGRPGPAGSRAGAVGRGRGPHCVADKVMLRPVSARDPDL